jgi:hypothetical protein
MIRQKDFRPIVSASMYRFPVFPSLAVAFIARIRKRIDLLHRP